MPELKQRLQKLIEEWEADADMTEAMFDKESTEVGILMQALVKAQRACVEELKELVK